MEFFRNHLSRWTEQAEAIGLDAQQLATLTAELEAAEAARREAVAIQQAARSATNAFYRAEKRLTATGRAAIATIKARAAKEQNSSVYSQAWLSPPSPGSPTPAPARPMWGDVWIDTNGAVHLSWKAEASGPSSGVYFMILRRAPGEAMWRTLDAVQRTSFIDEHPAPLTPGESTVYALIARRGDKRSPMSPMLAVRPAHAVRLAEAPKTKERSAA